MGMMTIAEKWQHLQRGDKPRVLDLFAGCGGFSLGLQRLGWHILGGLEQEPERAQTYAHNLHKDDSDDRRSLHGRARDILATDPHALLSELDPSSTRGIDVIVGGPPCQAYARVGRAKLREIAEHPEAFLQDERGKLHAAYVHYVKALQPLIVIMENVPEILNYGQENIGEKVAIELEQLGYRVCYALLNAAWYGVPQTRDRFFLVGFNSHMKLEPTFPAPTHAYELPPGYRGTRSHALKLVSGTQLGTVVNRQASSSGRGQTVSSSLAKHHYIHVQPAQGLTQHAVGSEDALGDLPPLNLEQIQAKSKQMHERHPYATSDDTSFRKEMRRWPGFEGVSSGVTAHVCRSNAKDRHIFERMPEGADYPQAHALAIELFQEKLASKRVQGCDLTKDTPQWTTLYNEIVPCYDPSKYPNKWRKLERHAPSRTLMSHLSHDCYSHIHYDNLQARTISVREAARLQSFPDGFEFPCSMVAAFAQIGNAVPPLLAFAIGSEIQRVVGAALTCE